MILDALLLELILLLAAYIGLSAWQRDPSTTGRVSFCALCVAVAATAAGELLDLRDLATEAAADRVKYAGLLTLPPLWIGFTTHVAGLDLARRLPWFPALLMLPGLFLFGLMFDSRYGVLFVVTVENGDDVHGPLWLAACFYGQALAVAGTAVLSTVAMRAPRPAQVARRLALVAASLLPVAGNALYVAEWLAWPYDPTPLFLGVALLAMRSAVFEGGLVEPMPISQRDLVHQLPLGVILTDRHGHIVEMSDVAGNRLGVFEEFALGRRLDDVLAWCEPTPLRTQDLMHRGRPTGRLVLLE